MSVLPFETDADIAAAVEPVRRHLDGGGLLAYPTETVYGLGSRPLEGDVRRLANLKGRQAGKPFLLLVPDRATAVQLGLEFTAAAQALADRFWPGPLTLVLDGGASLPAMLRGPERGIAVRWTSHRGMAVLLRELGAAVTSTSANRPGEATAPGVTALTTSFADEVRDGTLLVLDGGVLGNVPPSTIVSCMNSKERPRVIREGAIPVAELRAAVGTLAP